MSDHGLAIKEHSEPFVCNLIQAQARRRQVGVTISDLIDGLALPTSSLDERTTATGLLVIAGGAASGKSTLAESIMQVLASRGTTSATISSDDYVRWDREKRHRREAAGMRPEAKYNFKKLCRIIGAICANQDPGRYVEVPQYDPHSGTALNGKNRRLIPKVDLLIVEGDMLGKKGKSPQDLYPSEALNPMAMYVHTSDEVRLSRRVERDRLKRNSQGATDDEIARSFEYRQETQHLPYTLTYAEAADIILMPSISQPDFGVEAYDAYPLLAA